MSTLDLVYLTGIVYGLSWLITQSSLLSPVRSAIARWSLFAAKLLSCIVCTSAWVCIAVLAFVPTATLNIRPTMPDVPLLLGWVLGSTWVVARLVGDAD